MSGQVPTAEEIIGPNGETACKVFIDGGDGPIKLPSKCALTPTDHHSHQPKLLTTGEAWLSKWLLQSYSALFLSHRRTFRIIPSKGQGSWGGWGWWKGQEGVNEVLCNSLLQDWNILSCRERLKQEGKQLHCRKFQKLTRFTRPPPLSKQ